MGIIKKYRQYKLFLQISLFLNVFLFGFGMVALVRWLQTHDVTSIEMSLVGMGVVIFGMVLPFYIFSQITKLILESKRQTEKLVAQYVSEWILAIRDHEEGDALKDPKFWLNMALVLVETIGEHSKHPVLQVLAELAPVFRKEFKAVAKKHEKAKHGPRPIS